MCLTLATASALTPTQKAAIGRKVWKNECAGTVDGLTSWNGGEGFPSLGIGHFIWYPAGQRGPFTESWPQFIAFAKKQGAQPPSVALSTACPWPSRKDFYADFKSPRLSALRQWLAANVPLQTDFIVSHSQAALPKLLDAARPADRAMLAANYQKVAATGNGTYALIDYVNFKGEGVNPGERYNGRGWGLLQVLAEMRDVPAGQAAAAEFAACAKRVLERRIANSPPARGEARWREGWRSRCDSYAKPL
jgi:hypothetical protein